MFFLAHHIALFLSLSYAQAIDSITVLGYCHNITYTSDHYLNYNEGVWFPQYRTWSEQNKEFSCHTVWEDTFYDDGLKLQQMSYHTWNGIPEKSAFVLYFDVTDDRGIYEAIDYIPELGGVQTRMYMMALNSDYRIRYMCTDHPDADKNLNSLFIETRRDAPPLSMINEAVEVIRKNGLSIRLDKINQKNCTRPLSDKGYTSYTTDENVSDKKSRDQ